MNENEEGITFTRPFAKVHVTDLNGKRIVHEVYGRIAISDIPLLPWFAEVAEVHDFEYCNGEKSVSESFMRDAPPIGQRNEKERTYTPITQRLSPMRLDVSFELGTWETPSTLNASKKDEPHGKEI